MAGEGMCQPLSGAHPGFHHTVHSSKLGMALSTASGVEGWRMVSRELCLGRGRGGGGRRLLKVGGHCGPPGSRGGAEARLLGNGV